MKPRPLTTAEVCQLTGMSYRQADYLAPWVGLGRMGSGSRRPWSGVQVVRAWVIHTLMRMGIYSEEAARLADLVKPGDVMLVIPPMRELAYTTVDLLDALDGVAAEGITTIVTIPERIRALMEHQPQLVPPSVLLDQ